MSFAAVEQLKAQYTDKLVEVDPSVPELRRFKGLVGTVKTVNMNGRLLIQFDHPVDIGWYDIDPAYLRIVEGKTKKAGAAKPSEKAAESPPASAAKVSAPSKPEPPKAVSTSTGPVAAAEASAKPLSKLEQARQQGAAGKAAPAASPVAAAPAAAAPAAGGRPLSKLEMARLQGAAGSTKTPSSATPAAPSAAAAPPIQSPPVTASAPATGGKPLSKLELARQQGAFGGGAGGATPAASAPVPASAAPASPPAPVAASTAKPIAKTGPDGKPLSKLELARLQGPFKG